MSRDTQIEEEEKQKQVVVGNRSTNWTAEKTKNEKTFCFAFGMISWQWRSKVKLSIYILNNYINFHLHKKISISQCTHCDLWALYELVYGPARRIPVITGYKKDKSTHYILKFLVHPKDMDEEAIYLEMLPTSLHLKWTEEEWKTVLWSEKSKFEILFKNMDATSSELKRGTIQLVINTQFKSLQLWWYGGAYGIGSMHQCISAERYPEVLEQHMQHMLP